MSDWKECKHKWKMKEWWQDGMPANPKAFGWVKCTKCKLELYVQSHDVDICHECGEPAGICPNLDACVEVTA